MFQKRMDFNTYIQDISANNVLNYFYSVDFELRIVVI